MINATRIFQTMLSEADKLLLDRVRRGDADGWNRFICRFQRRLIAFANGRVENTETAEDLVQDTFVLFLQSMHQFRAESELETFLFQILRRRIIDHYRARGSSRAISACSLGSTDPQSGPSTNDSPDSIASDEETNRAAYFELGTAIRSVTSRLREQHSFRDLCIAEGIFYAGLKNRDLAERIGCESSEIAMVKHRLLQRLASAIEPALVTQSTYRVQLQNDLLTRVWEQQRPSCPKRTTLGKYVLEILPIDWAEYINFHVNQLGCTYCIANLTELNDIQVADPDDRSAARLFQSTIGFLASP